MAATTWDTNNRSSTETLSGGNLTATSSGTGTVAATRSLTGLTYFEVTPSTLTGTVSVGLVNRAYNMASGTILGTDNNGIGYKSSGAVVLNNVTLTTIASYAAGNVIGVAVDIKNRLIWFRVGTGSWNNSGTANPATGAGGIDYSSMALTALQPGAGGSLTGAVLTAAFTTFVNAAPTGYITADTCQATAVNSDYKEAGAAPEPIGTILTARSTFQMGHSATGGSPGFVNPVPVATALAGGIVGVAYSETIDVQGSAPPFTRSIYSGSLPTGTALTGSTGVISGTPTTAGTFSFVIAATDAIGNVGYQSFSIVIAVPTAGNYGWAA